MKEKEELCSFNIWRFVFGTFKAFCQWNKTKKEMMVICVHCVKLHGEELFVTRFDLKKKPFDISISFDLLVKSLDSRQKVTKWADLSHWREVGCEFFWKIIASKRAWTKHQRSIVYSVERKTSFNLAFAYVCETKKRNITKEAQDHYLNKLRSGVYCFISRRFSSSFVSLILENSELASEPEWNAILRENSAATSIPIPYAKFN